MRRSEISADLEEYYVFLLNNQYEKVVEGLAKDQRNEAKELVLRASLGLSRFDRVYKKMEKDLELKMFSATITMNRYPLKAREILEEVMNEKDMEIRKLYISTLINLKDYEFCYDWLNAFPLEDDQVLRKMVDDAKTGKHSIFVIEDSESEDSESNFDAEEGNLVGNGQDAQTTGEKDFGNNASISGDYPSDPGNNNQSASSKWNQNTKKILDSAESKIVIQFARKYLPTAAFVISLLLYAVNRGRKTSIGKLISWFEEKLYKTIQMGSSI